MATSRNLRILPGGRINGIPGRIVRGAGLVRLSMRPAAGPVLFLGGVTYAAAFVLLGTSGATILSGALAVAGTILIVLGLHRTWER